MDVLIPAYRIRFLNRPAGQTPGYVVDCDRCGGPVRDAPVATSTVGVLDEVTARFVARLIANHEAAVHDRHPIVFGPTDARDHQKGPRS